MYAGPLCRDREYAAIADTAFACFAAWGGVAASVLEYLRDDYKSTPIITFAMSPQL
eukprot:SAG11_NODE_13316_length_660_cov_1.306595_2_plen_55_part_01